MISETLFLQLAPDVRRRIAGDETAPIEILKIFLNDENIHVRSVLAQNPGIFSDLTFVDAISLDSSVQVVRSLLSSLSENIPWHILDRLSEHGDLQVRYLVASNKNTTPEKLRLLAKSQDEDVLTALAKNSNTPFDILPLLIHVKDKVALEVIKKRLEDG